VRTTADVTTPEQFEAIIVGGNTYVRDVASVTLGPDVGQTSLRSDGKTGIGLGIIRQASRTRSTFQTASPPRSPNIQKTLPEGMSIGHQRRRSLRRGAIHEVEMALALSVSIVLIVIYLFLLDWRATLIPASPCRWR
jgi:HAE1 family hydrophobic/amphiphilic exporter-1